jgi:glycosyltransferase involved in cell wall biosynthesis
LELLKAVLKEIYLRYKVSLLVIGTDNFFIPGVPLRAIPWERATELTDLHQIDIGLMPLPDDEWGRGKCALKAMQYMALEIPTLCSPVGVNKEIITDGLNGFLCATDKEWVEKISRLIEQPLLRKSIGKAARQTIEQKFSVRAHAKRFVSLLEGVALSKTVTVGHP